MKVRRINCVDQKNFEICFVHSGFMIVAVNFCLHYSFILDYSQVDFKMWEL